MAYTARFQNRLPIVDRVTVSQIHRDIELIEAERSMTSDEFLAAFRAGELPETPDNVNWARLIVTAERVVRH